MVGHYADGAKVIGLTDAELYKQLKLFNYATDSNGENSPYARNNHSVLLREIERQLKRKEPVKPYGLGGPKYPKRKNQKAESRNRITLKIIGLDKMSKGPLLFPRITVNDAAIEKASVLARKDRFALPANFSQLPALHR